MYKYQEELINNLQDSIMKIQEMTEEHYKLIIGECRFTDKREILGTFNVYMVINGEDFFCIDDGGIGYDYYGTEIAHCGQYLFKFDENIFIKLNNLIDKILDENKKREETYENLNRKLEELNKSLEV